MHIGLLCTLLNDDKCLFLKYFEMSLTHTSSMSLLFIDVVY